MVPQYMTENALRLSLEILTLNMTFDDEGKPKNVPTIPEVISGAKKLIKFIESYDSESGPGVDPNAPVKDVLP